MSEKISLFLVFYILLFHWIADFVFQTDKMARGKSKEWWPLLSHTLTYSAVMIIALGILSGINYMKNGETIPTSVILHFAWITFIFHTAQDYITSRINSRLHAAGKIHEFFVSIGFDQLLHFIQLLLTLQLLTT